MKTLVEKSIKLMGIGHPETKTIFDGESEKKDIRYKNLEIFKNTQRSLSFKYTTDSNSDQTEQIIRFKVPVDKTELEIRDYILSLINEELNK